MKAGPKVRVAERINEPNNIREAGVLLHQLSLRGLYDYDNVMRTDQSVWMLWLKGGGTGENN